MSFTRTAAGLSNSAQFYDVDAVLYVEGKPQTVADSVGSLDLLFWRTVFNSYAPNLSVQILCKGGKPILLELADQVQREEIPNVLIGMDRDYDPELGSSIDHPAVLYTWGYSWENDVWTLSNIQKMINKYALVQPVPNEIVELVDSTYSNFLRSAKRYARANLATRLAGDETIVPTKDCRALVRLSRNSPPSFNKEFFRDRLRSFREQKTGGFTVHGVQISEGRHCLGHFIAYFGYHLVCSVLRRLGHNAKIDFDMMSTIAINTIETFRDEQSDERHLYYLGIKDHIAPCLS